MRTEKDEIVKKINQKNIKMLSYVTIKKIAIKKTTLSPKNQNCLFERFFQKLPWTFETHCIY